MVHDVGDEFRRGYIDREILKCLFSHPEKETLLVLNKIDKLKNKNVLLDLVAELTGGFIDNKRFLDKGSVHRNHAQKTAGRASSSSSSDSFDYDQLFSRTAQKLNITLPEDSDSAGTKQVLRLLDELKECEKHFMQNLNEIKVNLSDEKQPPPTPSTDLASQLLSNKENKELREITEISAVEFKKDLMKTTDWHLFYKKLSNISLLIQDKKHWPYFNQVFMVSAQQNDGVDELRRYLFERGRPGNWLFPRCLLTDQLPKDIAENCVREKMLEVSSISTT